MLREIRWSIGSIFYYIAHLAGSKGFQPNDGNFIIRADFVIVLGVSKSQRQQALLLQVCLCEEEKNMEISDMTARH